MPLHPLPSPLVDPVVWDTSNPTCFTHATAVLICLKDPSVFHCVPQYPTTPKHLWGRRPLICHLLSNGFLKVTHSLYNTPILPVLKPDGSHQFVQDLRAISDAVTSIHPIVPNPYTVLSCISPSTSHFSVLDLKDAFSTISLHPECQDLFAFT